MVEEQLKITLTIAICRPAELDVVMILSENFVMFLRYFSSLYCLLYTLFRIKMKPVIVSYL